MTAVAGVWRLDGRPSAGDACNRILNAQAIYGTRANKTWSDEPVALGSRLTPLLPEDRFDRQPVVGASGNIALVADIRLDNRRELSEALSIASERSAELSDSDLLLKAIERWGENCFDHLVGDYAFAWWDAAKRRLILARDPLGMRPLHYFRSGALFAFASMPKGLHALPEIPVAPDEERVAEFLALLPEHGPKSFFKDIARVEPANYVVVTPNGVETHRYWSPKPHSIFLKRDDDYVEAARELLDNAVRQQMRGSNKVAAALTSGMDSSAVATSAALQLAASGGRLLALTAVPRQGYREDARYRVDESEFAAETAAMHSNIEHVLVRSEGQSPLDDLDKSFFLYDRPVLNICNNLWVNALHETVRARGINVLLTGHGGNLGLSYSGSNFLSELVRAGRWIQLVREGSALSKTGHMRWRGVIAHAFGPWCPGPLWVWLIQRFRDETLNIEDVAAIDPAKFRQLQSGSVRYRDPYWRPAKDAFAPRFAMCSVSDPGNYNKGYLAGWQVDCRDPLSDRRLVEFCLGIPTEQYLRNGVTRALARGVLAGRVADRVLNDVRGATQGADWHEKLAPVRARVHEEIDRLGDCGPAARVIDVERLRRIEASWPSGTWQPSQTSVPFRMALLRALSTGHFVRRAAGSNR